MIHPNTQRLSTTPWFKQHPDLAKMHLSKLGDIDYCEYLEDGLWLSRDLYVIPLSPMFTNQFNDIPDDFYFEIPEDVVSEIKNRKIYLLWDQSFELFSPDIMNKLFVRDTLWASRAQRFMENTQNHYDLVKDWCGCIVGNNKWQEVHSPWYETLTVQWHEQCWYTDTPQNKSAKLTNYHKLNNMKYQMSEPRGKKYISTMGMIRDHKLEMARYLHDNDWLQHGYVSLTENTTEFPDQEDLNLPWCLDLPGFKTWHRKPTQVYTKDKTHWTYSDKLLNMYLDSSVEIICDSVMQDTILTCEFNQTSDRPFKSFALGKPFIYLGPQKALSYLRELGFKTFKSIWDETYDVLPDWRDRIHYAKKNVEKLCKASPKEIAMLTSQITDIIEHNYHNYQTNFADKNHLRHLKRERYL